MAKATKSKAFQFGESFEQLNKIVEQLESGDVDLDKALGLYEDGLKIVQACKKHLNQVENRVRIIRETYGADSPLPVEE
ncbi:MAG: exodeoxyribonuclease VII small subunit [Parcubacteria group bacterium]|nr:exodeoxyribonuclease VII small subunit [Parcubacteria group bacterium]